VPSVTSALRVSLFSVAWTVVASTLAVAIGIRSHAAVLVAFGAIGVVDAIGSVALVHHFRRSLRDGEVADEFERIVHRIVLAGLFTVGGASVVVGVVRLALGAGSDASHAGVALAATSLVALSALSLRKQQIAGRISSGALRSDGHLSGVGAMQAAVALAGTGLAAAVGWHWADAAATALVGSVAIGLAVSTWKSESG